MNRMISLYLIIACDVSLLISFITYYYEYISSNSYQNKKNKNTEYRLQARAKTSPLERKTRKSLLFLIDSSIDKFQDLKIETNTLQYQDQPLWMMC